MDDVLDGQAPSQTIGGNRQDGQTDDLSGPSTMRFPSPESNPKHPETRTNPCPKRESKSPEPENDKADWQSPFTRSTFAVRQLIARPLGLGCAGYAPQSAGGRRR